MMGKTYIVISREKQYARSCKLAKWSCNIDTLILTYKWDSNSALWKSAAQYIMALPATVICIVSLSSLLIDLVEWDKYTLRSQNWQGVWNTLRSVVAFSLASSKSFCRELAAFSFSFSLLSSWDCLLSSWDCKAAYLASHSCFRVFSRASDSACRSFNLLACCELMLAMASFLAVSSSSICLRWASSTLLEPSKHKV